MPDVSVVVCTLDRAASLDRLLWSLASQTAPAGNFEVSFEVVVVNNRPGDGAQAVASAYAARLPGLRLVDEPVLGLSTARNRGVSASSGELVAFIDDDAEAGEGWLAAIADRFSDPAVAALGGRIDLVFPTGWPSWLPTRLAGHYAGLDLGPEPFLLQAPRVPYGTNMVVRRGVLDEIGGFLTSLGRRGRSLISNEEVELFGRVRASGAAIWYDPAVQVLHHVELERATRRYLVRRAFAQGRSMALQEEHQETGRTPRQWRRRAVGATSAVLRCGPGLVRAAGAGGPGGPETMAVVGRAANRGGYAVEAVLASRREAAGSEPHAAERTG